MRARRQVTVMKTGSYVAFGVVCAIWGSAWVPLGVLAQSMPAPLFSAAARFLIAGGVLAGVSVASGSKWPSTRHTRGVLLLSATFFGLPYGLMIWSAGHVSLGLSVGISATMPLCAAILTPFIAPPIGRKEIPSNAIQSMILGLGGVVLVVYGALSTSGGQVEGALAALIAVVLTVASMLYAKRELAGVSPITAASLLLIGAAVWLASGSMLLEHDQLTGWSRQTVEALLVLSLLGTALAYSVFFWLLQRIEPYKLAATQLILPVVAAAEGYVALREQPPWTMWCGAAAVLASVAALLRIHGDEGELLTLKAMK